MLLHHACAKIQSMFRASRQKNVIISICDGWYTNRFRKKPFSQISPTSSCWAEESGSLVSDPTASSQTRVIHYNDARNMEIKQGQYYGRTDRGGKGINPVLDFLDTKTAIWPNCAAGDTRSQ